MLIVRVSTIILMLILSIDPAFAMMAPEPEPTPIDFCSVALMVGAAMCSWRSLQKTAPSYEQIPTKNEPN